MVRLRELETRTQEIIFLFFISLISFFILGGGLYLYLSPTALISIIGTSGKLVLTALFHELGYAYFLIPLCLYYLAEHVVETSNTVSVLLRQTVSNLMQVLFYTAIILIVASFLSVFESYFAIAAHKKLVAGIGGLAGKSIGGILFQHIGLLGSVLALGSMATTIGVFSGKFDLVDTLIFIHDYCVWLGKKLWKDTCRFTDFCVRTLGYSNKDFVDNSMEFEASSGSYSHSSPAPAIEQHAETAKVRLDIPQEHRSEVEIETYSKKENNSKELKVPLKPTFKGIKRKLDKKETGEILSSEGTTTSEDKAEFTIKRWKKRKYHAPSLSLLSKPKKQTKFKETEIQEQSALLEDQLNSFKLNGKIIKAHVSARLIMYEFQPEPGVKLSKIASIDSDLALVLGAPSIRILTPIPGKKTVGIEVPHSKPSVISFYEMINSVKQKSKLALPIILGKTVHNESVISGIEEFPHMLISGSTGSGKSVFMNTIINSLLFYKSPRELQFIMIDPKMIELTPYNDIPHLFRPVITDITEAKNALKWAEQEMDKRYVLFKEFGSRNIESFNEKIGKGSKKSKHLKEEVEALPYIVIVVDELADLIITQGKEVEMPITRIAQKARAAGIHLLIATQRPSTDIVSGLIKTNFPTRISFKVSSSIDSRTILDTTGAEKLLGNGDMLYLSNGNPIQRIQSSFISEQEVQKIVQNLKKNN